MLIDEFMPVYDVSDAVATVVDADLATTWAALMDVDVIEVGPKRPLIAVLGATANPARHRQPSVARRAAASTARAHASVSGRHAMPPPAARQRRTASVVVRPTPHHPAVHHANATCSRAPRSHRTREAPRPNRLDPPTPHTTQGTSVAASSFARVARGHPRPPSGVRPHGATVRGHSPIHSSRDGDGRDVSPIAAGTRQDPAARLQIHPPSRRSGSAPSRWV